MNKRIHKLLMLLVVFALAATLLPMYVNANTVTLLDGNIKVNDTGNNLENSNGTLSATAKGSLFSKGTNTITVINASSNTATISFDYSATSGATSFTLDDVSTSGGTYSKVLAPGGTATLYIQSNSGFSANTITLTLKNFSFTVAAASSNVTINYDSNLGSVTADGSTVDSGTTQEVSLSNGIALAATPNGSTFLGWIDEADGRILSTKASDTLQFSSDTIIKAVFAQNGGTPWFGVGTTTQKSQSCGTAHLKKIYYHEVGVTHLFDDLNAAAAVASGKAVVLMNDATLPAGDYTIPASVTLLIPFDTTNTMYTVGAQYNTGTYTQPSEYRTLTMDAGAKLVINGAMSVSAKLKYAEGGSTYGGVPVGNTGFVRMNQGSTITVNNGGALYVYGYVIGSGEVTAKSGSTVYEGFQIMDFRGGAQSSGMKHNVFPMSQYYVQNIEVPLTLEAGATEHAYTWMMMSIKIDQYYYNSDIEFIGSDKAMFKLSSGSVTKRYDPGTDRLIIEVNGDLDISSVSLTFDSSGSISSEKYVLGLNGNISVIVNSGTININQDMAFLPGVHMTIGKGASVVIGEGKRLYVYDSTEWGPYVHWANTEEVYVRPLIYAPTRNPQKNEDKITNGNNLSDASILIEGTLDASLGTIYTTASGAQITGSNGGMIKTKPGTETITYQVEDQKTSNNPDEADYAEIPITPAKLINSDGTIIETGDGTTNESTYNYLNGFWHKGALHTDTNEDLECDTCSAYLVKLAAIEASADAETELRLKFLVHPDLVSGTTAHVIFRDEEERAVTLSELTPDAGDRYVIIQPIASGEMTCPVTVTMTKGEAKIPIVISADGSTSDSVSRSVVDYARLALTKGNAQQKALVAALVTYGGYAQVNFNVDQENPANNILSEEAIVSALAGISLPDIDTVTQDTINKSLNNEASLTELTGVTHQAFLASAIYQEVYFQFGNAVDIRQYSFVLTYPKDGSTATTVLTPKETDTANKYAVMIPDIPAAYMDDDYVIIVTNTSTGQSTTVTTCIFAFLNSVLKQSSDENLCNLAKAMYLYGTAATEYFGK